jgi:nitrogen fixation NifU-like protein
MSGEIIETIGSSNGIREMLLNAGYSDKAIQYYLEKPYMGSLPDADQVSEMTGTCGDSMAVYLKVAHGKVTDVMYQVMGCAGAVSAAMAAVDLVKGKKIEDARNLEDGDIFRVLQDIPVQKHHCIQLAVKALHKTIDAYQQSQITKPKIQNSSLK